MSKFVSHKPGEIINGDGSISEATIFVTSDGQEEAIPTGSPIEKLLLDEVDGTAPLLLPAAGETTASVEPVIEPVVEAPVEPVVLQNVTTVPVDAVVAPVQDSETTVVPVTGDVA